MDETPETIGTKAKRFMKKYGRRIGTAALVVGAFALGAYMQRDYEDESVEIEELEGEGFKVIEAEPVDDNK